MALAVVAIGSNIQPEKHVVAAVEALAKRVELLRLSRVYETPPVGAPGTPPFLNAALLAQAEISPAALREGVLRPLEAALGRVRTADPNAPRTIDLDLVVWATDAGHVTWYDPQVLRHAHVALPVAEVAPEWVLPDLGLSLRQVAAQLADQARAFRRRPDVEEMLKRHLPHVPVAEGTEDWDVKSG